MFRILQSKITERTTWQELESAYSQVSRCLVQLTALKNELWDRRDLPAMKD